MRNAKFVRPLAGALVLAGALACTQPRTLSHRSGLMEFLYPKKKEAPVPSPGGAKLHLPLKLGVVFVPSPGGAPRSAGAVAPTQEKALLEVVKNAFKDKPWIKEIRIIPSSYLMAQGGFDNLDQVAGMYGVEDMVLVSVDQIQYNDPKWYSIAYLSIVGAYVLPGDQNDTRTLIDAAVFHVPTRTFLLRAPGQSIVKGSSTLVNRDARLREQGAQGLELAMGDLTRNLAIEVASFKADVASGDRKDVDLVDQEGHSLKASGGQNFGGAFDGVSMTAGLALAGLVLLRRRRP